MKEAEESKETEWDDPLLRRKVNPITSLSMGKIMGFIKKNFKTRSAHEDLSVTFLPSTHREICGQVLMDAWCDFE